MGRSKRFCRQTQTGFSKSAGEGVAAFPPVVHGLGEEALCRRGALYRAKRVSLGGLLLLPLQCLAAVVPYAYTRSFTSSEPIAIDAVIHDWDSTFHGGGSAVTFNHAEIGARAGQWSLGLLARLDYQADFHPDTVELYYFTQNKLPLTEGRSYTVDMGVRHSLSRGVRLGYDFEVQPGLTAALGLSYLKGLELTDGHLSGGAEAINESDLNFQFDVDYSYSRDSLFHRDVNAPSGSGYALDLGLSWRRDRFSAQLEVRDLLGFIDWKEAPFTTATANTNNKRFDESGYVIFDPMISGVESYHDFRQELPRKLFLSAQYQWASWSNLLLDYSDLRVKQFTDAGFGLTSERWGKLGLLYGLDTDAITLRYAYTPYALFSITADTLDVEAAQTLGLRLEVNWPL